MKVTNEKTENSQTYLTIEMEKAEVDLSLEESYHRLVQRTKIPGFRKGKAPRAILERYIGKESLLEDTLNNLVPQAYEKAIKEQSIEAIGQPKLEVTQTDPIIFKAVVPLKPKVTLGDYHSIRVAEKPVDEVKDSDIDGVIEQLQHQHATWEPVDRPVEYNDLVTFDIDSKMDDKPFIVQKGVQYQVIKELTYPVPGFADQLVGMEKNKEKEFALKFPEDYANKELVGKEPSFKVTVTEIKKEALPEANDEFAKSVDPQFQTLAALKERIQTDLESRAHERVHIAFEDELLDKLVGISQIEFPPILVDAETNRILNQRFQRGPEELEQYLQAVNKTEEQLHTEMAPASTKNVSRSLVLGQVAEDEKLDVTAQEIDAEIEKMTKDATQNKEEMVKFLNTPQMRLSLRQQLLTRKTYEVLENIAKQDAVKETKETKAAKETEEPKEKKTPKRKKKEEEK